MLKNINYENSLTNLACSIASYFDISYKNKTLKVIDDILEEKHPQNVILILCDGMGLNLIKRNLGTDSFLYKNIKTTINSVFPSTTAAATTSLITGLNPCEHGWLGWENYIAPVNEIVTMYLNKKKDTEKLVASYNVPLKYFSYETIMHKINIDNKYHATYLSPFSETKYKKFDGMLDKIKNNLNIKEKNYIYAYYENPDALMHDHGTTDSCVIENFKMINDSLEKFCNEIKNSLIIITADHGHINSSYFYMTDYPDLFNLLIRNTSIDSRASMFFVKDGEQDHFKELFTRYFGEYFELLSKEEIIKTHLFGVGEEHPLFKSSLGDFIAIATKDKNIKYQRYGHVMVSTHAGNTDDETLVPLIVIDRSNS